MVIDDNINTSIERLKQNLERLKQNYTRLKAENQELFEQKQELLKTINQKDEEIAQLKKKIENLKITEALIISDFTAENAEDLQEIKHSAKIKLNKIIRKIDEALKILSTNELQ